MRRVSVYAAKRDDRYSHAARQLAGMEQAERGSPRGAARWKYGRQHARIGAGEGGARKPWRAVCAHRHQPGATFGLHVFGPMDAMRANALRQRWVRRNQQREAACACDVHQFACCRGAVGGAEMPINDSRAPWQAPCDGTRIWRTFGVSEEKQRRNGRRPCIAVEALRLRG